jgi:hypothetical protein
MKFVGGVALAISGCDPAAGDRRQLGSATGATSVATETTQWNERHAGEILPRLARKHRRGCALSTELVPLP